MGHVATIDDVLPLVPSPSASSSLSCCPVLRKYFRRMTKMMAKGMAAMKM